MYIFMIRFSLVLRFIVSIQFGIVLSSLITVSIEGEPFLKRVSLKGYALLPRQRQGEFAVHIEGAHGDEGKAVIAGEGKGSADAVGQV